MNFDPLQIQSGMTAGLKWSTVRFAKEGEQKCGDTHLIKKYRDKILVAAIDGLGHGKIAARASDSMKYLLKSFKDESLINLVNYCHGKLNSERGVVMSLALLDSWEDTLTWLGVGNVEGSLLHVSDTGIETDSIIRGNGIVGYKLPKLKASILSISSGDILIFTTDGVNNDYLNDIDAGKSPEEIVKYIAENSVDHSDDALILVAKYMGKEIYGKD